MTTEEEDRPIQKFLKVGKARIGLMGLDSALSQALAKKMAASDAATFIYERIASHNYIPPGGEDAYRQALREEYLRLAGKLDGGGAADIRDGPGATGGEAGRKGRLVIRILGPGCVSCNRIYTISIAILQQYNIAADIEAIHELDEIWRYGVTTTPALVINGRVMSAGRLPTPSEIEQWLREAAEL